MQDCDEDEEAFRQRYIAFLREVDTIIEEGDRAVEEARATGSTAAVANARIANTFALADAMDRLCNVGARQQFEDTTRMLREALESEQPPRTKRERKEALKKLRLEIVAAAYEQRLIAAEFLGPGPVPASPGMASAYAIAGKISEKEPKLASTLPVLSPDAVEKLRYRWAAPKAQTEKGRFVRWNECEKRYEDTDGPISDLLDRLPQTFKKPKR